MHIPSYAVGEQTKKALNPEGKRAFDILSNWEFVIPPVAQILYATHSPNGEALPELPYWILFSYYSRTGSIHHIRIICVCAASLIVRDASKCITRGKCCGTPIIFRRTCQCDESRISNLDI
jgi:hypothetical protein